MIRYFLVLSILVIFSQCKNTAKTKNDVSYGENIAVATEQIPLFVNQRDNYLVELRSSADGDLDTTTIKQVIIHFAEKSEINSISRISLQYIAHKDTIELASSSAIDRTVSLTLHQRVALDKKIFYLNFEATPDADLTSTFQIQSIEVIFGTDLRRSIAIKSHNAFRLARIVRAAGEDNVHTYRIPGLITTANGTLIAVYDNRYKSSRDLQGDIAIGMSRSTDGGQHWEPMEVIMDRAGWGGLPRKLNGTGDPCIFYDQITHTVWVAALWLHGHDGMTAWRGSQPGMSPDKTGQLLLVKSTDDGLTWSKPINITKQVKNPEWQLLLQGPGRGIMTRNGVLVFPAQFKVNTGEKAIDGGEYTCFSTVIFSRDHGKTWHIGTGAKSNTTESQVTELRDGSLMLNMRDDRNRKDKGATNGRAIYITKDFGKTWTQYQSSNSALPEPNCQASLISSTVPFQGKKQQVLFFSNPNSKTQRAHMTIKSSVDEGVTWPLKYQLELNATSGYGYSCMTMVDNRTIGILYEGTGDLIFQKIPVDALFEN